MTVNLEVIRVRVNVQTRPPDQLDDIWRIEIESKKAEYGTLRNTEEDNRSGRYGSVVANELSTTLKIRSDLVEHRSAHAETETKSLH